MNWKPKEINESQSNKTISTIIILLSSLIPFFVIPFWHESIVFPKIISIAVTIVCILIFFAPFIISFFRSKPVVPIPLKWLFIYLLLMTITLPFSTYIWRSLVGHSTRLEGYFVLLLYGALMILTAFFIGPSLGTLSFT